MIGRWLASWGRSKGRERTGRKLFGASDAALSEQRLAKWRHENPDRPWRDAYVSAMDVVIAAGRPHSTIGGNLHDGPFEASGLEEFKTLLELGLQPQHRCVDYGCGTLRIGQHIIRHLYPDHYVGIEIASNLIEIGTSLVGPAIVSEKRPRLYVLSPDTVDKATAFGPDFLFSWKVMQHVHPEELPEYIANICTIIGESGRAYICSSKWRDADTVQYHSLGWSHNLSSLREIARSRGFDLEIVNARSTRLPIVGREERASSGILALQKAA